MNANYYTPGRKLLLNALNLEEVVAHLENGFRGVGQSDLRNYDEARSWYEMVLANAGDISANFISPRAKAVDEKGVTFQAGKVEWAPETKENMKALAQAGLMGGTLPRKYGGLNLPMAVNTVLVEMVSQADASLMNLFGLQEIALTVCKFGSEEQRQRVLPRFARGEVSGSMALTEPDAGSDLQAVALRAVEKNGRWYLNGVKRFITNGCGEISLVLARSEPDVKGARGLSMFLYERDDRMIIRRLEEKLGIHGSPTCEMQFDMAPAELVGERKFGLIKYVMSLMDGARLAVSAQAMGIAQAAFDEAVRYANEREQFGKKIVGFPAVYQMLKHMQAEIETTRLLLYHTAMAVDLMDVYNGRAEQGQDVREQQKRSAQLAGFLTPLAKLATTELANKVAYDALQIHGGCGYMKDFAVERLYRDARITNIYEGTTQLQVVAAIGGLVSNLFRSEMDKVEALALHDLVEEKRRTLALAKRLQNVVEKVKQQKDKDFIDYVASYLVEMASVVYRCGLYLPVAELNPARRDLFDFFLGESEVKVEFLASRVELIEGKYAGRMGCLKQDFVR